MTSSSALRTWRGRSAWALGLARLFAFKDSIERIARRSGAGALPSAGLLDALDRPAGGPPIVVLDALTLLEPSDFS
jgi:hypothetical protein